MALTDNDGREQRKGEEKTKFYECEILRHPFMNGWPTLVMSP